MSNNITVYSLYNRKTVKAFRQSNQTILVDRNKLSDSDLQIVEDKYGHRYARNIALENSLNYEKYIFDII